MFPASRHHLVAEDEQEITKDRKSLYEEKGNKGKRELKPIKIKYEKNATRFNPFTFFFH